MSDYTVPTLSLSNSRSKKQYTSSVPTRDSSLYPPSHIYQPTTTIHHETQYIHYIPQQPADRMRRTHIFPPRPPGVPVEVAPRDINKNVYLQSPQINQNSNAHVQFLHPAEQVRNFQPVSAYQGLAHSSSGRRLLGNPQSSKVVHTQVSERTVSRKSDMAKMLFDRKISKLLSEASFYEQELLGVGRDELSPHLQELISIKESSLNEQKMLIEGLTALIK